VGGRTNDKNDIIMDGTASMTAQKSSYTPPLDAVQQVSIQQNAVDAEFGHSAGGIIVMDMKSGTNEYHGTAYYAGRNPDLNALADRMTLTNNATRQSTYGGTLGSMRTGMWEGRVKYTMGSYLGGAGAELLADGEKEKPLPAAWT